VIDALSAVFGAPGAPAGALTRLRWRLEAPAAARAVAGARARALAGDYVGAATILRAACAAAPQEPRLALATAALARFGMTRAAEAAALLRRAMAADAPGALRDAAREALLALLWERVGATAEVAALARATLSATTGSARALRACAALHAAGETAEAVDAVRALRRRAPRAVARLGHLALLGALAAAGETGFVHAAAARRAAAALAAGDGLFERLVAEAGGDVALAAPGPGMQGRGLGPDIDARRLVVRFNAFGGCAADHGRRTDIWMRPHRCEHVPARHVPGLRLMVITGCGLRSRFADGAPALARLAAFGAPLATPPAALYRRLFATLEAAPSVGLLGLTWAVEAAAGRVDGPRPFGYGLHLNGHAVSRYHDRVVTGSRPGRHNWKAEQAVFESLVGNVAAAGAR
jgi:hypothetical protein